MNRVTELKKITNPADLDRAMEIYMTSFPEEERRPWDLVVSPVTVGEPELFGIYVGDTMSGMITLWTLGDMVYVEHFAVDPTVRGGGIGSRVLDCVKSLAAGRSVVLEVEHEHSSPEAERRVAFYRRHGFELLKYHYVQPPYLPSLPEVEMSLMSTDPATDPAVLAAALHRSVYKVGQ